MFKTNKITFAILLISFLSFTLLLEPKMINTSLSEVVNSCHESEKSKACATSTTNFEKMTFRNGAIYLFLGLTTIFYTIYFVVKVGVYHLSRGRVSVYSKVAKMIFETENDLEELVLFSNKAYAPKWVLHDQIKSMGLIPDTAVGNGRNKFVYQKKVVNGSEVFMLIGME